MKNFLLLLCLSLLSTASFAQKTSEQFGDYQVVYSVFNSSFIQPDIAKAYNITRAKDRALINIAVVKQTDNGLTQGLEASSIKGSIRNLMQQQKALEFTTIREQNAVYYLAPIRVSNEEVVHIDIAIQVEGQPPFTFTFTRKLYVDP